LQQAFAQTLYQQVCLSGSTLQARSMPAYVSRAIKCDCCILYMFCRCDLLPFQKLYTLML